MRVPVFEGESAGCLVAEGDALAADLAYDAAGLVLALGWLGGGDEVGIGEGGEIARGGGLALAGVGGFVRVETDQRGTGGGEGDVHVHVGYVALKKRDGLIFVRETEKYVTDPGFREHNQSLIRTVSNSAEHVVNCCPGTSSKHMPFLFCGSLHVTRPRSPGFPCRTFHFSTGISRIIVISNGHLCDAFGHDLIAPSCVLLQSLAFPVCIGLLLLHGSRTEHTHLV